MLFTVTEDFLPFIGRTAEVYPMAIFPGVFDFLPFLPFLPPSWRGLARRLAPRVCQSDADADEGQFAISDHHGDIGSPEVPVNDLRNKHYLSAVTAVMRPDVAQRVRPPLTWMVCPVT